MTFTTVIWMIASAAWLFLVVRIVRAPLAPTHQRFLIGLAIAVHAYAMMHPPVYSDDIARYQWDGLVVSHNISAYRYAPNDPALTWLHTATLPARVTYPHIHTIYPPVAEWWFAASTMLCGTTDAWKIPTGAVVGVALWLLVGLLDDHGRPRRYALIAALCPLLIVHGTMDAHVDVLMMCFFLAALRLYQRWPILGGIALALSIGVKFLPVLALPWMLTALKRRAAVMLAVATAVTTAVIFAVSYDPWMFSALNTYTAVWSANSVWPMVFAPFVATPRHVRVVLGIVLLVLLIVVWRRYQGNAIIGMQLTLMSVYIMSPVLHPWYVIPAIALTAMRPMRSTIVLATMMSLYGIIVDGQQKSGMWFEHPALLVVEIVPVIVAYLIDMRRPPSLLDEGAMQHTVPA